MTNQASNNVALITGSSRGIGLAIATKLAERGAHVVLSGRDQAALKQACQALRDSDYRADYLELDIASDDSVARAVKELESRAGRIDVLINNAGINNAMDPTEQSLLTLQSDQARRHFEVNALGALRAASAVVPGMRERGYGRIVNVSTEMASLAGATSDPYPLAGSYRISKAALNAVTVLLARELAGSGVLVNAYSPGWVRSNMGGPHAPLDPEQGAETALYLATLPEDGPTGGFFAEMRWVGTPVALPW